jgi:hypothetical protein
MPDESQNINQSGGINIDGSVSAQGDVIGRDAIKHFFNMMLIVSPPALTEEGKRDLSGTRILTDEYLDKLDNLSNVDDRINLLVDTFRKWLGPFDSETYLQEIGVLGAVLGPSVLANPRPVKKVLSYARIIDGLFESVTEHLAHLNCFDLYGHEIQYTYYESQWVHDSEPSPALRTRSTAHTS